MSDWTILWNFINSNLMGLIIAAILGVILASVIQHFQNEQEKRGQTKYVALALGYEIAQMKEIAAATSKANREIFNKFKREAKPTRFIRINDADLFRTIYDRPSTNLAVLPSELVPIISDLYRHVEICNNVKRLGNEVAQMSQLLQDWKNFPANVSIASEAKTAISQYNLYAESYLTNLEGIVSTCGIALQGLSKIVTIDPSKIQKVTMVEPTTQVVTPI